MTRLSSVCSLFGGITIAIGLFAAVLVGVGNIPTGLVVGVGGVTLGLLWLVLGAILDLLTDISKSLKRNGAQSPSIQRLPKD